MVSSEWGETCGRIILGDGPMGWALQEKVRSSHEVSDSQVRKRANVEETSIIR